MNNTTDATKEARLFIFLKQIHVIHALCDSCFLSVNLLFYYLFEFIYGSVIQFSVFVIALNILYIFKKNGSKLAGISQL